MTQRFWACAFLVVVSACNEQEISGPTAPDPPVSLPPSMPGSSEIFVGAGDIGWCGLPGSALTASLLDGIGGTVFTVGDNAYPSGARGHFAECYDPTWGRHRVRTRPTPGNHDYETPGAEGYFAYFGARAGPTGLGYYGYSLGSWRMLALNSEISAFPGSPQFEWLRGELAANPTRCALAYFHTPVFGSGTNGGNPHMQAVWTVLYGSGVDVIVNGHSHSYERFAPQDPDGRLDPARGIRQFVVGTGGALLTGFSFIRPNSEARNGTTWGVLKLTLQADSYDWEFVPVAGQTYSDLGNGRCH